MNDIEKLLALEEIKKVFALRLQYNDAKRWDLYPTLHTEDAVSLTMGSTLPTDQQPVSDQGEINKLVGPHVITDFVRNFFENPYPITSVHHGHTPVIEFTSDTEATGVWQMEDHLWWTDGKREEFLHGYGYYDEKYRKVNGKWLICFRNLTRTRMDHTPGFFDR